MENLLRQKREALGMTQAELAKKSGVCRATISSLENNVGRNISSRTIIALAEALNCTVDAVFFTPHA